MEGLKRERVVMHDAPHCLGEMPQKENGLDCSVCRYKPECRKVRDRTVRLLSHEFIKLSDAGSWWKKRFHSNYASGDALEMKDAWNRAYRCYTGETFKGVAPTFDESYKKAAKFCYHKRINANLWVCAQFRHFYGAYRQGVKIFKPGMLGGAPAVERYRAFVADHEKRGIAVDSAQFMLANTRSAERDVYVEALDYENELVTARLLGDPDASWRATTALVEKPPRAWNKVIKGDALAVDLAPFSLLRLLAYIRIKTCHEILRFFKLPPETVLIKPERTYSYGKIAYDELYDDLITVCTQRRPRPSNNNNGVHVVQSVQIGTLIGGKNA